MSSSWLWQPFGSCFCSIMVPTSHSGLENSVEQPYSWKRLRIHAWKHWCWPHCIGDPLYWDWDPGHRDRATGTGPPGPGHRDRATGPGHRDRATGTGETGTGTGIGIGPPPSKQTGAGTGPGHWATKTRPGQDRRQTGRDRDRATGPRQKKGARHGTGPPGPGIGTGTRTGPHEPGPDKNKPVPFEEGKVCLHSMDIYIYLYIEEKLRRSNWAFR